MKKWRCTVCGYIHEGNEPPEKCPVCGADRSKFTPAEGSPEPSAETSSQELRQDHRRGERTETQNASAPPTDRGSANTEPSSDRRPRPGNINSSIFSRVQLSHFSQFLTRYHAHPIAVHIPNGVLPLSVLFTLLAWIFGSQSMAIAAQFNLVFVALTMPVVIGTGLIDWINSFKGRMTRIFRIKMTCAGIVTFLSFVLAIWGIIQPGIYTSTLSKNWLFILLHLANLGAASVAGWYGGKLVFRK